MMGLKETGCEDTDWIHLAWSRVQWESRGLGSDHSGFINGGEFPYWLSYC
jgi:hypothetical protein